MKNSSPVSGDAEGSASEDAEDPHMKPESATTARKASDVRSIHSCVNICKALPCSMYIWKIPSVPLSSIYRLRAVAGRGAVDVEVSFGTAELYVPASWHVVCNVSSSFGSVNEHGRPALSSEEELTITGDVSFGSLEIIISEPFSYIPFPAPPQGRGSFHRSGNGCPGPMGTRFRFSALLKHYISFNYLRLYAFHSLILLNWDDNPIFLNISPYSINI